MSFYDEVPFILTLKTQELMAAFRLRLRTRAELVSSFRASGSPVFIRLIYEARVPIVLSI